MYIYTYMYVYIYIYIHIYIYAYTFDEVAKTTESTKVKKEQANVCICQF